MPYNRELVETMTTIYEAIIVQFEPKPNHTSDRVYFQNQIDVYRYIFEVLPTLDDGTYIYVQELSQYPTEPQGRDHG